MKKYSLNGKWQMSGNGYAVEGNIPGSVYSFLYMDNALLPDPYYRDNEDIYLELAEHEYTFTKTFKSDENFRPTSLVFDGLDTLCDVYLNGEKIAETDNMHLRYVFDIRSRVQTGENVIKVVCHPINPYIKEKNKEQRLFGAMDCMAGYSHVRKAHCMMGWDWGPRLPDMGIWRDVYLLEKDSAEITETHITQRHEKGRVFLTPAVEIDGGNANDAEIEIRFTAPDGEEIFLQANAENEIKNPKLWMPNGLGKQHLYTLKITLKEQGKAVDEKTLKIGLRDMKLVRKADEFGESFYHEINGVDMFAMGADYIPEDNIFSRITPERTRKLLSQCKACNFNAIRVWGGGYYPDDYFFDICDELGLVVFFDLMYACSVYEPSAKMKESIREEVVQNVKRIRHHACMGLICGNNEIEWHFREYVAISGRTDVEHLENIYMELFEKDFPNWLAELAPYIAYIPSSPTSGGAFVNPSGEEKGDCHDWEPNYLLSRNHYFRYVSEFGFQAFPCMKTIEGFTEEKDRNVNSEIMDRHQRSYMGNELIISYLTKNYLYPNNFATFVYASQLLQAESIKYRVEHMRRHRGRCMGALYWQLNDIWPVTSWASIDYNGRWKGLQYTAKRFYAPILLSCEEVGELQNHPYINSEKGSYLTEKSACLCVTNDTLETVKGKVKWEIRDAQSGVIKQGENEICVAPLSVCRLERMYFDDLNTRKEHLHFALEIDEKIYSEGSVLFTQPKYYKFENPCLRYRLDGDAILISSDTYAKGVQIEGADGDVILEDNFFDMEKGEKRVRILSGKAEKFVLRSVYDIR